MRRVIVGGLLLALLAGCASRADRDGAEASAVPAGCPDLNPTGPMSTDYASLALLPEDAEAVGLVRCDLTFETDTTGRWQWAVESRAASGWEPLVAALRLGDETRPVWDLASQTCALALTVLPWTAVALEDGSWMHVGAPVTSCSDLLPEVMTALDGVVWEEVSRTRGPQIATPDELDLEAQAEALGCATEWKDMISVVAADPASEPQGPLIPEGTTSVVACRYSVASPGEVGQFVAGARLTREQTESLVARLSDAVPDPGSCAAAGTGFALLYRGSGGGPVTVELGGCSRALGESGGLAQVPDTVVALLNGATP